MTAKSKSSLINLTAFIGAIVAVTGLTGGAKRLADEHYVRSDTFLVYQVRQQSKTALDSTRHDRELAEINARLARMDSSTRCLRNRKPDYCA